MGSPGQRVELHPGGHRQEQQGQRPRAVAPLEKQVDREEPPRGGDRELVLCHERAVARDEGPDHEGDGEQDQRGRREPCAHARERDGGAGGGRRDLGPLRQFVDAVVGSDPHRGAADRRGGVHRLVALQ